PAVAVEVDDLGGRTLATGLECEGQGIRLERLEIAPRPHDLVLVVGPRSHGGKEQLPDSVSRVEAHRVAAAVPAVPVPDDADAPGIGSPYREDGAVDAVELGGMSAQLVVHAVVCAFREEVKVEVR